MASWQRTVGAGEHEKIAEDKDVIEPDAQDHKGHEGVHEAEPVPALGRRVEEPRDGERELHCKS